jgi:hypothetical protein
VTPPSASRIPAVAPSPAPARPGGVPAREGPRHAGRACLRPSSPMARPGRFLPRPSIGLRRWDTEQVVSACTRAAGADGLACEHPRASGCCRPQAISPRAVSVRLGSRQRLQSVVLAIILTRSGDST